MKIEYCLGPLCFAPIDINAPRVFGFSEFLAALALMVLAWTTSDIRSRFRIATAPIPLHALTFASITFVGVLTLLTDLWIAQGWLVPAGHILSPALWQAFLGAVFLLTFLGWAWFAFMRPPKYSKRNAARFIRYVYGVVVDASPVEMTTIAQELVRSVPALIRHAPQQTRTRATGKDDDTTDIPEVEGFAGDLLLLLADRRFCTTIVASSPGTIFALFQEVVKTKKFGVALEQFGRNVTGAAILDHNSFLYHETEGYSSGLIGFLKPLSQAVFGNFRLAESMPGLLDPDYNDQRNWSSKEWEAFSRAALVTWRDFARTPSWHTTSVFSRVFDTFQRSASDLYKLNGSEGASWDHDAVQRLDVAVEFAKQAIKILSETELPPDIHLRVRDSDPNYMRSVVDDLVDLIVKLMLTSADIKRPRDFSWMIQHNTVWGEFFGSFDSGKVWAIVRFKLRRKLYDEIVSGTDWANYKTSKVLAYCLNMVGLRLHTGQYGRDSRALQKAILAWTRRNFVRLEAKSPQVFAACFAEGLHYDKDMCRLVATSTVSAFRSAPEFFYFELDHLQVDPGSPARPKPARRTRKSHK